MKPRQKAPTGLLSMRAAQIASAVVILLCVALACLEFVYEKHPAFAFDDFYMLYPLTGFLTVAIAVFVSRLMRVMLGRSETYYGERDADVDDLDPEPRRHE